MIRSDPPVEPGPTIVLKTRPAIDLTDDEFFDLCQANRELRFERNAEGDILIMSPTGADTGRRGALIIASLVTWATADGRGIAFDSSTGFRLPDGSVRSPDASWVAKERYEALDAEQRQGFAALCPDFVIELRSPSDALAELQAKAARYIDNGARLAWLIDPEARRVHVYRPGKPAQELEAPSEISGEPELPGYKLALEAIWR